MSTESKSPSQRVRVTWVRSTINRPERHRRTIRALGLKRLNHTVEHALTPQIQGMIDQVCHLVRVEGLPAEASAKAGQTREKTR